MFIIGSLHIVASVYYTIAEDANKRLMNHSRIETI